MQLQTHDSLGLPGAATINEVELRDWRLAVDGCHGSVLAQGAALNWRLD